MLDNKVVEYIKDHGLLLWLVCTLGMPMALVAAVSLVTCSVVIPIYYLVNLF